MQCTKKLLIFTQKKTHTKLFYGNKFEEFLFSKTKFALKLRYMPFYGIKLFPFIKLYLEIQTW